jgi:two-component system chemotaxis response regulator CheB
MRLYRGSPGVRTGYTIVVIGASAGGVTALRTLIGGFDANWPVSVFITLHIGIHRSTLPNILSWNSSLPVQFAEHGKPFSRVVYVAPPDRHLLIGATDMFLGAGPKENHARPAIDPMFRSAATHHGPRVIGVLLTGHMQDGMNGLYDIHRHGGRTIVQHPDDAEIPEIPLNALRRLSPDYLLPVAKIPNAIAQQLETADDAKIRSRE